MKLESNLQGKYTAKIYVIDLQAMTESNEFKIIVKNSEEDQESEVHINNSEEENITNTTPEEINLYKCLDENKNKRPKFCLIGKESEYFDNTQFPLVNSLGQELGKIIPNRDLILKGNIFENTNLVPGEYSFEIKNSDELTTIWIDPINYNLYLKGNLFVNQETLI